MTDSVESLTRRVEELESQLAFQDELIESLNNIEAKELLRRPSSLPT